MSATIRDTFDARDYVSIEPRPNTSESNVWIEVHKGSGPWTSGVIVVDRAEFLGAVAAELDVVITPRADLPLVDTSDGAHVNTRFGIRGWSAANLRYLGEGTVARVRESALAWLALAEHLEANPPVDEAQVAALVDLMDVSNVNDIFGAREYARRLVQAGVRAPGEDQ